MQRSPQSASVSRPEVLTPRHTTPQILNHPRRERALELLLGGWTPAEVGAEIGCARETVYRWLRDPVFAAELTELRRLQRESAGRTLEAAATRVIRALVTIVEDTKVGVADRVRAGAAVLDRLDVLAVDPGSTPAQMTPAAASERNNGPDFSDEEVALMTRAIVLHRAGMPAAS